MTAVRRTFLLLAVLGPCLATGTLSAQPTTARAVLERAAEAMGGLERLRNLDSLVLTGFGQTVSQQGSGNLSPDPRAPQKWQATNAVKRSFDLKNGRALYEDRQAPMFPFAAARAELWPPTRRAQTGLAVLDHPLPALLAALAPDTALGGVHTEDDLIVVELTVVAGDTLWLAIDLDTHRPAWVRWISGSTTLGDVTNTTYFTGYLPFDGIWLPAGLTTSIDWRDTTTAVLHDDGRRFLFRRLPRAVLARTGVESNELNEGRTHGKKHT
jgi:hypothetical protein